MASARLAFAQVVLSHTEVPPPTPPADDVPAATTDTAHAEPSGTGPAAIPVPYDSEATGDLTPQEESDLATCEAAVDGLRLAFWAAGKALQVIRDARLYRQSHDSFEAYVAERWDMSRPQAYRLIAAWPLAERLSPIGDRLSESQIRELLPVADRHGTDAAATVYETVAETDGVKVTAAVLKGAVAVLPNTDRFDPAEASTQIRAYLAGEADPLAPVEADPAEVFAADVARVRSTIRRAFRRDSLRAVASTRPDEARKLAAELRELAAELDPGDG
ncbi:hypothetical protein [Actinomadura sp. 6N118]|uniref:hypothetical protein n=1 Tax=Actinomadura sp. 6N118 TaxID=3375151 RepID=UPI0037BDC6D4